MKSLYCLRNLFFIAEPNLLITVLTRDGNLGDISKAGSLHEFLMVLHKDFGPIASFWWGKRYTVSIASAELFQEVAHIFDRPG